MDRSMRVSPSRSAKSKSCQFSRMLHKQGNTFNVRPIPCMDYTYPTDIPIGYLENLNSTPDFRSFSQYGHTTICSPTLPGHLAVYCPFVLILLFLSGWIFSKRWTKLIFIEDLLVGSSIKYVAFIYRKPDKVSRSFTLCFTNMNKAYKLERRFSTHCSSREQEFGPHHLHLAAHKHMLISVRQDLVHPSVFTGHLHPYTDIHREIPAHTKIINSF